MKWLAYSILWFFALACFSIDFFMENSQAINETFRVKRSTFFTPFRSYLFVAQWSLIVLWTFFWPQPSEGPKFYWFTLPLRLAAATMSLISYPILFQTEAILLLGAYLPERLHQNKPKLISLALISVWLILLAPLFVSYITAEFLNIPNQWFLYSPLLWLPSQLEMIGAA